MRKLTILSLALLLTIGLFVTGCKKKTLAPENDKKTEVKAPAEKPAETSTEKQEAVSAAKADKTSEKVTENKEKEAVAPEQNEKAEVKAPAEKTVETPAKKEEKPSAAAVEADKDSSEKADKPSADK